MIDLLIAGLLSMVAGDPVELAQNTVAQPAQIESAAPAAEETTGPVQEAQAAPAATEVASNAPRRRCRNEVITGTRLPQRVCTTASQDAVMRDRAREDLHEAQGMIWLKPD